MVIIVQKAQEADIQRLLDIMYAAFSEDPWDRIMYPHIPGPEARGASIERWREEISNNPTMRFMKAVDTDLNEIIAFARWSIYEVERPESEWKVTKPRGWDIGTNVEAANEFYNAICETRQSYMGGKPHCCLNMLVCDPKHQRKGAGRMLVSWGLALADRLELEAYLEASAAGHHLYESAGFRDVGILKIDMSKYGGNGIHQHFVMKRDTRSPTNPRH